MQPLKNGNQPIKTTDLFKGGAVASAIAFAFC